MKKVRGLATLVAVLALVVAGGAGAAGPTTVTSTHTVGGGAG
jgi:hypothetical protein